MLRMFSGFCLLAHASQAKTNAFAATSRTMLATDPMSVECSTNPPVMTSKTQSNHLGGGSNSSCRGSSFIT